MIVKTHETISEDILHGADEIAEYLYGSAKYRRKVYHLTRVKKCGLPVFNMGSIICARKSKIKKWIQEQEDGGASYAGNRS